MSYNPEILPLAGGVLLMGILSIACRALVARSSNQLYRGTPVERVVPSQKKSEKWMIIVGTVLIVLAIGIAISGFFIS